MRVWRICREPFAELDGKGSELRGGPWTSPGRPVVYAAKHLALAILKVLVHLEVDVEELSDDYVSVEIDMPSVVVPKERNLSLNTIHVNFKAIEIVEVALFRFDPRLLSFA